MASRACLDLQVPIGRQSNRIEPDMDLDGGSSETGMKVAAGFSRLGRIVVEVVEPVAGPVDLFQDVLSPDSALSLHHLGIRVENVEAAKKTAEGTGEAVVLSGHFEDQIKFAFVDARSTVGHHLELVEFSESGWQLIAGILGTEEAEVR